MFNLFKGVIVVIFVLITASVFAQVKLLKADKIDLTGSIQYYVDTTKALQVRDFCKIPADKMKSVAFPAFEANDGAVWATVTLESEKPDSQSVIYFDQPILYSIDFWVLNDSSIEWHDSFDYDYQSAALNRYPHFDIPRFNGARKVIFRIETTFFPINSQIILAKNSVYERTEMMEGGFLLLCFGILLVIMVYGLVFFFTLKNKIYLWFLTYTSSMFVISILSFGFARILFGIHSATHNMLGIFLSSVALTFLILFMQSLINLKSVSKSLWVSSYIMAFFSWGIFLSHSITYLKIYSALCVSFLFVVPLVAYVRKRETMTIYFLLSSSSALVGIFIWGLVNSGYAPSNFFTHNALILGITIESVLYSFSLSYMIQKLDKEKSEALLKEKIELSSSNQRLIEIQNKLEDFIYRSHHDYRGPLARISGIVGLMEIDKPNLSTYFSSIKKETKNLKENFEKTLNSWEIERLNNLKVEEIKLKSEIKRIINDLKMFQFNDKLLNITINIPGDLTVYCDKKCLLLPIQYVIENSFAFTDTENCQVQIDYEWKEGVHHLYFKDNGIGLLPEIIPVIFERNIRGSSKSNGTGLGLYISKIALQKIKAQIEYVPDEEYTCFKISFVDLMGDTSYSFGIQPEEMTADHYFSGKYIKPSFI